MKCEYDPTILKNLPIGMLHCPKCGEMILAGSPHPDYNERGYNVEWLKEYSQVYIESKIQQEIERHPARGGRSLLDEFTILCPAYADRIVPTDSNYLIEILTSDPDLLQDVVKSEEFRTLEEVIRSVLKEISMRAMKDHARTLLVKEISAGRVLGV